MLRRKIGTTLAACGMIMMLFGFSAMPAQGAVPARPMLQPSPRPPLEPTSSPKELTIAVDQGHITGTVIDLTTGAPMPGVMVNVGGTIVLSDANGNYDRWVPVGTYSVVLALAPEQGAPAQDVMMVTVEPNAGTVQHLNFRSPVAAIVPAATPVAVKEAAPVAPEGPKRLPRTGVDVADADGSAGWRWLVFGMALLLTGGLVGFGPVLGGRSPALVLRAHAANSTLLRALLSTPLRKKARPNAKPDDLLAALLNVDAQKGDLDK
jgi:hypothetical protein